MENGENKPRSVNLETFEYTLSSDWSGFIKFCTTPMTEKEVKDFWNNED